MRFIAVDTSFVLHFKPLSEISASDIGQSPPFTWLIVGEVMRELDVRKGTGEKPLRKRARKSVQEFERAANGAAPFAGPHPLEVHFRQRPFDFEANGLLPNEGDHKILADILDFKKDHLADEVLFLSDDSGARLRASKYGVPAIDAPEALMREEIDDDRDARIRELEQENRTLSETQPQLELTFGDETKEMLAKIASFKKGEFEDLLRRAKEQGNDEDPTLAATSIPRGLAGMIDNLRRPNPKYDEELANFIERFRAYFEESWVQRYRTVEIMPIVHSKNGVQASRVSVRIRFKTKAGVLTSLPEAAKPPPKPRRSIDTFAAHFAVPEAAWPVSLAGVMDFVRAENAVSGPTVEEVDGSFEVCYSIGRITQEDSRDLDPFYLVFANDVQPSDGLGLSYEIRAENATRVLRGMLILKFETYEPRMPATYIMDVLQ